jgi:ParB family chromosome partitioning protein
MTVIEKVGRFLDPVVIVRNDEGYWTPNGNHRLQAMRKLGAQHDHRAARAGVRRRVQDSGAQHREGAQREREVARDDPDGARAGRGAGAGRESDYAFEFEQAPFLTLGAAYEQRRSLSGGAYSSLLRRIEDFLDDSLPKAVRERERRAAKLLKLDDACRAVVAALKERGLTSPYLKPFVIARVNPIRFSKATEFDFDEVMDKTIAAATRFKVDRVKQEDVARIGGAPPDEE